METIISLIVMIIILIIAILHFIIVDLANKVKVLFGYKQYEYTKILSNGMKKVYEWHKTDEQALDRYKEFEFVEIVIPVKKRLRSLI